jgi:hypothetical protein
VGEETKLNLTLLTLPSLVANNIYMTPNFVLAQKIGFVGTSFQFY